MHAVRDMEYPTPVKASASARGDQKPLFSFLLLAPRGLDLAWRHGRSRTARQASASNMFQLRMGRVKRRATCHHRPGNLQ